MNGIKLFSAAAAMALLPMASFAGETVLTVLGLGEPLTYDRDALSEMESATFKTSTIWTEGEQEFTGVPLVAFLEAIGVSEGDLKATAINDYAVEVPVSDAVESGPIIAYSLNGEEMSVRDKGPLWIVYPYDSNEEYQSEVIYSRSIWQLDRIEVLQ